MNQGEAGQVIKSFGTFVLQGNAIVGFIIFIIIVLVQFIVITKGAERVSEVAARFTLDAMPGKQMAIDADLSSGLIDETAARMRREKSREKLIFTALWMVRPRLLRVIPSCQSSSPQSTLSAVRRWAW